MPKLNVLKKRTLKLTNVLVREIECLEYGNVFAVVEQMENYAKSKGRVCRGPLIQYTYSDTTPSGEMSLSIKLMRQLDGYIQHIEQPYAMRSVISVKNCLYVRYIGAQEQVKIAGDKIRVMAFEEDIQVKKDQYIIFVDQHDDKIVADVFVETC